MQRAACMPPASMGSTSALFDGAQDKLFRDNWTELMDRQAKLNTPEQLLAHLAKLETLAQQMVVFVWFNAWQYTGQTDIWAGLVVVHSPMTLALLPFTDSTICALGRPCRDAVSTKDSISLIGAGSH